MIVCDWCHGVKGGVIKVSIKSIKGEFIFDLCGPCYTALNAVVIAEKRKRKELRPKSFLTEEV